MSEIEITQADRDLAGWFTRRMDGGGLYDGQASQVIAKHRHEARAEALGANKAWAEAVTAIMARCEALEDEAADEMAKDNTEHSVGYWRGQKMTAKAIRRELHDLTRALRSGEREG